MRTSIAMLLLLAIPAVAEDVEQPSRFREASRALYSTGLAIEAIEPIFNSVAEMSARNSGKVRQLNVDIKELRQRDAEHEALIKDLQSQIDALDAKVEALHGGPLEGGGSSGGTDGAN